jgi:hypothetical protein
MGLVNPERKGRGKAQLPKWISNFGLIPLEAWKQIHLAYTNV